MADPARAARALATVDVGVPGLVRSIRQPKTGVSGIGTDLPRRIASERRRQVRVCRGVSSRSASVLVIHRPPVTQPTAVIEHQDLTHPFDLKSIGHRMASVKDDWEAEPIGAGVLGHLVTRLLGVRIHAEERNAASAVRVGHRVKPGQHQVADRAFHTEKDQHDGAFVAELAKRDGMTGGRIAQGEIPDRLAESALRCSGSSAACHHVAKDAGQHKQPQQDRSPANRPDHDRSFQEQGLAE